jgi:hypothetical protein
VFDDIPEELNRWVLSAPKEIGEDPVVFGHFATQAVIAFYLRKLLDRKAPFLDFPENNKERIPWQQTMRLTQIAQAIFVLRREPGFGEICRRLATREDLRSVAFEAFAAQLFRERGFTVLARPETRVLGQDFDFAVMAGGFEINVEATALTVPSFSAGTIKSALSRKSVACRQTGGDCLLCSGFVARGGRGAGPTPGSGRDDISSRHQTD